MTKLAHLTAAAMIVLALAGCSSAQVPVKAERVAAPSATPSATASPTKDAAPVLTAAPPTPAEDEFYTATKRIPGLESVSSKDALEVGRFVCAQLASGVSPLDITAVQNTTQANNDDMIMVSTLTLCTDKNDAVQAAFIAERRKAMGL